MDREHAPSGTPSDAKSFKINTCKKSLSYAILRSISPFRINTCKTVSKQRTLTTFRMNTYEKQGEGGPVIVNQISDKKICPACPGLAGEKHRDDRRFRLCRKGPLFTHALSFPYFLTSLPRYFLPRSAFNSVHGDAAHELGKKIGGLLRHDFAGRRDFHHLLDAAGIQQKRNLLAPASVSFARNFFFTSDLSALPENGNSSAVNHGSRCRRTPLQEKSWTFAAKRCVGKIVSPSLFVLMNVIIARS